MDNKINGRTPKEIKKGLECDETYCTDTTCPYFRERDCFHSRHFDALTYIQQLEAERDELLQKIQRLEHERDAAVELLRGKCSECINEYPGISHLKDTECDNCIFNGSSYVQDEDHWQWRGVQE